MNDGCSCVSDGTVATITEDSDSELDSVSRGVVDQNSTDSDNRLELKAGLAGALDPLSISETLATEDYQE